MKLYTEEQIEQAIKMARSSQNIFTTSFIYDKHEIIEQLIPIELPSDDDIWNEADKEENNSKHYAFTRGAKWMRDKTQGGNK